MVRDPNQLLRLVEVDVKCESDATTLVLGTLYRAPPPPVVQPPVVQPSVVQPSEEGGDEGREADVVADGGDEEDAGDADNNDSRDVSRDSRDSSSVYEDYDDQDPEAEDSEAGEGEEAEEEPELVWYFVGSGLTAMGNSVEEMLPQLKQALVPIIDDIEPYVPPYMVEDEKEEGVVDVELDERQIREHLSLVTKTQDGVGHAYARVYAAKTHFTNLAPLATFTLLRYVYLPHNSFVDLTPLNALDTLMELAMPHNKVGESWSALTPRRWLESVDLGHNHVPAMTPVVHPSLRSLNLVHNRITQVTGLEDAPLLTKVALSSNAISSLRGVSAPHVEELHLGYNGIRVFGQGTFPALRILLLQHNNIRLTDGLESLPSLEVLNLAYNDVSDLDQITRLASLPSLRWLSLIETPLALSDDLGPDYRIEILAELKHLTVLDELDVDDLEREDATALFEERNAPPEEERGSEGGYDSSGYGGAEYDDY